MRLILVRHGRTTSNVGFLLDTAEPGADLDETGHEQAAGLVERLAAYPIEAIYTSNLVRTQQTAAPVAAQRRLVPHVLPGLREVSAGDDELSSDATRYIGTLLRWRDGDLAARIPGGEDAGEFFHRFDAAIADIVASGRQTALAVSHGAALRTWATGRVAGFIDALGNGHLDNTGMLVIDGAPGRWTLEYLDGVLTYQGVEFEPDPIDAPVAYAQD